MATLTMALRRLHLDDRPCPDRERAVAQRTRRRGAQLSLPLFEELDRLGYDGFLGCEYRPRGKTVDGLAWFAPHAGKMPPSGGGA